jgi:primosomal protein N' (replication factor Y)
VGRRDSNGKVLIQTRYPEDKNLKELKSGDYLHFALKNLKQKKELHHPPYSAVCLLRASSPLADHNIKFLSKVANTLNIESEISAIGPIPSIISKTRGNLRHHLIIQTGSKTLLNKYVKDIIDSILSWDETKKVRWFFDIDPIDYS